jgi:PD-(D/E)XK nuclease superfamily
LAAALKQLLVIISVGRIPEQPYSRKWNAYRDTPFEYRKGDTWDRLLHQGIHLLQRFAQDDRVQVAKPAENLQVKMLKSLPGNNEFVAYIDALGKVDGQKCLIDWKTTTNSYPEGPSGLLALDPQLICYSWITGISEVALVVFVRKAHPEIQYLKTSITEHQRQEFGELARSVIGQIERGEFLAHSGIRFPSNGCVSCAHLGLCLHQQDLIDTQLIRRPGASDLDWLEQLSD